MVHFDWQLARFDSGKRLRGVNLELSGKGSFSGFSLREFPSGKVLRAQEAP